MNNNLSFSVNIYYQELQSVASLHPFFPSLLFLLFSLCDVLYLPIYSSLLPTTQLTLRVCTATSISIVFIVSSPELHNIFFLMLVTLSASCLGFLICWFCYVLFCFLRRSGPPHSTQFLVSSSPIPVFIF